MNLVSLHGPCRGLLQDTVTLATDKGTMADFATFSLGAPTHGNYAVANARLECSAGLT